MIGWGARRRYPDEEPIRMSVAETDRPMSWSFPQPVAEDALAGHPGGG